MINSYELPASLQFVDTHVDLPIQTMSMLAEAYKNQYEQAQLQYLNYVSNYGDFTSPIASDVAGYNQLTVGRLLNVISNLNDPEWLKTPEGLAAINNVISTTNYGLLAKYKLSAANAQEYLKTAAAMQAAGKYNPTWDLLSGMSPNNWSTDKNGVFNYTAPIEYKSMYDLTQPYYQELLNGVIGSKWNGPIKYNILGVSKLNLSLVALNSYPDVMNTALGLMYYKMLKNKGLNDDQAKQEMVNEIAQSHLDRAMNPTYQVDQGSLAMYNAAQEMARQRMSDANQIALEKMRENNSLAVAGLKAGSKNGTGSALGGGNASLTNMLIADLNNQNLKLIGNQSSVRFAHKFALNMINNLTHPNKANGGHIIKFQQAVNQPISIGGKITTPKQILDNYNSYVNYSKASMGTTNKDQAAAYSRMANAYQNELADTAYKGLLSNAYEHASGKTANIIQSAYSPFLTGTPTRDAYSKAITLVYNDVSAPLMGDASTSIANAIATGDKDKNGWYPLSTGHNLVMPEHIMSNLSGVNMGNNKSATPITNLGDLIEQHQLPAGSTYRLNGKYIYYNDNKTGERKMSAGAIVKVPYDELRSRLSNTYNPVHSFFSSYDSMLLKDYPGIRFSNENVGSGEKAEKVKYAYIPVGINVPNGVEEQNANMNYFNSQMDKKQASANYDQSALSAEGILMQ